MSFLWVGLGCIYRFGNIADLQKRSVFLRRALESVLLQGPSVTEVLVIDDNVDAQESDLVSEVARSFADSWILDN